MFVLRYLNENKMVDFFFFLNIVYVLIFNIMFKSLCRKLLLIKFCRLFGCYRCFSLIIGFLKELYL